MATPATVNPSQLAPQNDTTPASIQKMCDNFLSRLERRTKELAQDERAWTPLEKVLGQHLFFKVDASLKAAETKRLGNSKKQNDPPFTWANVNTVKLEEDTRRIISYKLDAFLPNHVEIMPYLNSRTKQYDFDVRPGYKGDTIIKTKFSIEPIIDIRYELVHETDQFDSGYDSNGIAYVTHKRTNPFNPGKVIGGYGYIQYENPKKNRVILVEYREFEKARKASKSADFWGGVQTKWVDNKPVQGEYDEKFEKEMQYKTVVYRVNAKINVDPEKIHDYETWLSEQRIDAIEAESDEVVETHANGSILSLDAPVNVDEATGEVIEEQKQEQKEALPF